MCTLLACIFFMPHRKIKKSLEKTLWQFEQPGPGRERERWSKRRERILNYEYKSLQTFFFLETTTIIMQNMIGMK